MAARRNRLLETWNSDVDEILQHDIPWERFSGRRVAVTGPGGFLGGYMARTLLALHRSGRVTEPVEVVAVVRSVDRARGRLPDVADDPQLSFLEWDLNTIAVPPLVDIDYVIHAASQASPRFYGVDPVGTALPNSVGTAALLTALQRGRDPQGFLFVSSGEVYGAVPESRELAETVFGPLDPISVRSAYGESKRLGESLCVGWHQQYGLPTHIVRPFHTYGPGLLPNDGRIFADFAFDVIHGENLAMASDGSAVRTYCYASDAVAGFFTVMLTGEPATAYNVSNREAELSVLELAELLIGLYPERGLVVARQERSDSRAYLPSPYRRLIPDVTRLKDLGWAPRVDPIEGFRRMIDAYPYAPREGLDEIGRLSR